SMKPTNSASVGDCSPTSGMHELPSTAYREHATSRSTGGATRGPRRRRLAESAGYIDDKLCPRSVGRVLTRALDMGRPGVAGQNQGGVAEVEVVLAANDRLDRRLARGVGVVDRDVVDRRAAVRPGRSGVVDDHASGRAPHLAGRVAYAAVQVP